MDFIAIDLDKYDVWDAFRQPVPVKAQMYLQPNEKTQTYTQYANFECNGPRNNDNCTVTNPRTQREVPGGGGPGSNPRGGAAPSTRATAPTGGASSTSPSVQSRRACLVEQGDERGVDTAAQQFVDELRRDFLNGSITPTLEHGALIVEVNGRIFALPRVTGTERMIPLSTFTDGPNGLIASNLSWSNIVGIIHSHPPSTESTPLRRRNDDLFQRAPSTGDLAIAEFFSQLGGGQNVTTYITSPDGDLLEYEGYEQPDWAREGYEDDQIQSAIEGATSENESDAAGVCV